MNIMETKDNYKLELCIPGLTKEDVKLSIDVEGNLVVEMSKETKNEKKENKEEMRYLRHEFSVEHFRQTVMLPDDIHKDQISAKVENGILDIVIPKVTVEEKKQAMQTIEVC
jgi:HSP20 family protein